MTADFNQDIRAAVSVLRKGGVILYPTDTVWGLGCDATNPEAVRKVFAIKRRSDAKALITLVGSLAQLERTVDCIPEVAYQLIEYADRPTTIIYDHPSAAARIAPELVAEDGTIGVRVTAEAFSSALCTAFRLPLVSTSANISGGSLAKALAIATLCLWPPDSSLGICSYRLPRPTRSKSINALSCRSLLESLWA